jgi:hypothetical protein
MNRLMIVSAATACCLAAGCAGDVNLDDKIPAGARAALKHAESFELYSLDPDFKQKKAGEGFNDWKVLGKTTVKEAATRGRLLTALNQGVKENDGQVAACFNPRHGIRVKAGDKTLDLVICFECYQVEVHEGGKRTGHFLTTGSPQRVFDEVLRAAGVELPKKAKD